MNLYPEALLILTVLCSNYIITGKKPTNIAICLLISALATIFYYLTIKEGWKDAYNSALVTGKLAGGTVYASYPEMTPGIGWI